MISLLFELLQVSLGARKGLSRVPTEEEWNHLYLLTAYQGIQKLFAPCLLRGLTTESGENALALMPERLLTSWIALSIRLKDKNQKISEECAIVENRLRRVTKEIPEGDLTLPLRISILKGQGLAQYYKTAGGDDLGAVREAGDIDVWMSGGWFRLLRLARSIGSRSDYDYKHIHLPALKKRSIELHWRPAALTNLIANYRLQSFVEGHQDEMDAVEVTNPMASFTFHSPSIRMNRLLLLAHSYGHFIGEGLRMKQLLDYYFVVKQPLPEVQMQEEKRLLKKLHLTKYASAVTWVILQMDPSFSKETLPAEPNEAEGRFLMNRILPNGNPANKKRFNSSYSRLRTLSQTWCELARALWRHYPEEVLWWPVWKAAMFVWKRMAMIRMAIHE